MKIIRSIGGRRRFIVNGDHWAPFIIGRRMLGFFEWYVNEIIVRIGVVH